jgi:hypothetical protein
MSRAIQVLFHQSPYVGWIVVGAVFVLLVALWLLTERFATMTRTTVRVRSTIFTAFVVLDLVALILLGSLHVGRVDLTRDKLYSLSPASRALVEKLQDVVTAEVFFPEEVPPEMVAFRESLVDLLDELRDAASGRLVVRYMDPRDPGVVERARALGIEPAPFVAIEAGKQVQKEVMRGVALTYRGQTECIPVIDRDVGLEYQFATLLRTLTGTPRKVGVLTGHKELRGMFEQPEFLEALRNVLSYQEIVTVDLGGGEKPVPDDIQALLLATPTDPLNDAEIYQLDQFLVRGGSLAFFGNGFSVMEQSPQMRMMGQFQPPEIKPLDEKLAGLFEHLGFRVTDGVVLDDDADDGVRRVRTLQMTRGGGVRPGVSAQTNLFWTKDISEGHPVTYGVTNAPVLDGSRIDLTEAILTRDDVKKTTLVQSPPASWEATSSEAVLPQSFGGMPPQKPEVRDEATDEERARAERGPRPLMVAIEGRVESYFAGQDVPGPAKAEGRKEKSEGAVRVLAFGTAVPFVPDALKVKDVQNILLNAADWLLSEKGLLEIRGKSAEPPPFKKELDKAHQNKWTAMLVGGWPFLFLAASLGLLFLVRSYRKGPRALAAAAGKEAGEEGRDEGGRGEARKKKEADERDEVQP